MHMVRRGEGARIHNKLYKTEMCRSWVQNNGQCGYGDRCQYAHGATDLRRVMRHPKYKTEPCQSFMFHGICNYGSRCHFIHDEYDNVVDNSPAEYSFVPMHNPNWQHVYTPSGYYPTMVVQGPRVVEKQVATPSASADSGCESVGADSPVGSESGDRVPFTAGFMDPKDLFMRARSPARDFSPFDKKHEILENLLRCDDAMTYKKQSARLPVFAHLSPSKP